MFWRFVINSDAEFVFTTTQNARCCLQVFFLPEVENPINLSAEFNFYQDFSNHQPAWPNTAALAQRERRLYSADGRGDYADTRRFRKPSATRVAPSNRAVEPVSGTVPKSENAWLKVGAGLPPTMSVPSRSQSGSILPSRVHAWRSGVKTVLGAASGLVAESHKKNGLFSPVSSTWGTKK